MFAPPDPGTRRGRRLESGLTLLEVTMTIALLGAMALSIALLVVPVARQSRLNSELSTANLEVNKTLERIQSTAFRELEETYPDGVELTVPGLSDGRLVVSYEDTAADPLMMRIDLSWDSPDVGTIERAFYTARTE